MLEDDDDDDFLATSEDDEGLEEEEDFSLLSSASKAGARVLTIVSRSDFFDKDWTAKRTYTNILWLKVKKNLF